MSLLKRLGTISEKDFFDTNWQPYTSLQPPFPLIPRFKSYLVSHGSASLSVPTTSATLTFNADWSIFRNDNGILDKDRYIVSASIAQGLIVYKLPPVLTPHHHVSTSDPILKELSVEGLKILENFLE